MMQSMPNFIVSTEINNLNNNYPQDAIDTTVLKMYILYKVGRFEEIQGIRENILNALNHKVILKNYRAIIGGIDVSFTGIAGVKRDNSLAINDEGVNLEYDYSDIFLAGDELNDYANDIVYLLKYIANALTPEQAIAYINNSPFSADIRRAIGEATNMMDPDNFQIDINQINDIIPPVQPQDPYQIIQNRNNNGQNLPPVDPNLPVQPQVDPNLPVQPQVDPNPPVQPPVDPNKARIIAMVLAPSITFVALGGTGGTLWALANYNLLGDNLNLYIVENLLKVIPTDQKTVIAIIENPIAQIGSIVIGSAILAGIALLITHFATREVE